jgi:transposase
MSTIATRPREDRIVDAEIVTKKKTYSQNWSAYNNAQCMEKDFLYKILDDLLILVKDDKKFGRPSVPLRDQIFAICVQQYEGISGRRSQCDIKSAFEHHYLYKRIHFNTLLKCYNNPVLTNILKYLISKTSEPLRDLEDTFAVDSSGFSTSQFHRWFDTKYGKHSNRRFFRKLHITTGVKTNIITAAKVTTGYSSDSPELPELIRTTNKIFDVKVVCADKGYLARSNFESINSIGAVPFIPFKENSGPTGNGYLWFKFNTYFTKRKEEFKDMYHLRSNVESTFSMIKRKLGMKLRTKGEVSQTNEILVKCLLHNVCVLIEEACESNIDINFFDSCVDESNGED